MTPPTTPEVKHTSPDRQTDLPVPDVKPAGFVAPPPGSGMQRYLDQKIDWKSCDYDYECATVAVPLDYDAPDDQAITLALKRKTSTSPGRIGSLFINPGGPGAVGTSFVETFENRGLEQFDIVGWDPRGTGASTPVKCFDADSTDAFLGLDQSPDDAQERTRLIEGTKKFVASCLEHSGVLLQHISTQDTARDLDVLRQLVGDDELYYDGVSYGTMIGATYAHLFPDKVGRLVLDAAVNITEDNSTIQAMGFETAFSSFLKWCASQECELGNTPEEVKKNIGDWLDGLDSKPVPVGERKLTQSLAISGIALFLYYDEDYYPYLVEFITSAQRGDAGQLLAASDSLNGREEDGNYGSLFYGFNAVLCADVADDGVEGADREWAADQKKAPFFSKYFGVGYTCPLWPVEPAEQLHMTASGAKPIMVIGGTGDSATPYQQAVWMADQLESGFLVTFNGEGHGAYGGKSRCIDDAVVKYLTQGTVPEKDPNCSAG